MKTIKIIVFAAIALFGLVSCSDEKKALNYVSEKVLSDSKLSDFLIKNKILMFKDSFEPELRYYLNSILGEKQIYFYKVYLSDEFAHVYPNSGGKGDFWKYYRPDNDVDSDRILDTILQLIQIKSDGVISNDTIDFNVFSSYHWTKEKFFNYILSQATYKSYGIAKDEMEQSGLFSEIVKNYHDNYNCTELYDTENYKIGFDYWKCVDAFQYDWFVLGIKNMQWTVIEKAVHYIVSSCRDEVLAKNYKLVDKQCTTVGENKYDVTYLLDPKLEIHFEVSKVGKTFVLKSYHVIED
ncbi:MAG: hypothetical protein J6Y98_02160 [Bacteroidales bacterium]|nr:hypothetical protein [Bacteroidales bacterium]